MNSLKKIVSAVIVLVSENFKMFLLGEDESVYWLGQQFGMYNLHLEGQQN